MKNEFFVGIQNFISLHLIRTGSLLSDFLSDEEEKI